MPLNAYFAATVVTVLSLIFVYFLLRLDQRTLPKCVYPLNCRDHQNVTQEANGRWLFAKDCFADDAVPCIAEIFLHESSRPLTSLYIHSTWSV